MRFTYPLGRPTSKATSVVVRGLVAVAVMLLRAVWRWSAATRTTEYALDELAGRPFLGEISSDSRRMVYLLLLLLLCSAREVVDRGTYRDAVLVLLPWQRLVELVRLDAVAMALGAADGGGVSEVGRRLLLTAIKHGRPANTWRGGGVLQLLVLRRTAAAIVKMRRRRGCLLLLLLLQFLLLL